MEKKTEVYENKNGFTVRKTTTTTTPEDGFVSQEKIRPSDPDAIGKVHMGYSKNVNFTTNDPYVALIFVSIMCMIFIVIGIFLFRYAMSTDMLPLKLGATYFLGFSIYAGYGATKECIDNIKKDKENKKKQ